MRNIPDIWGGGQLLAFSGIDGRTDFHRGLCLRTAFSGYDLELKRPHEGRVRYTGGAPERVELAGDFFRLCTADRVSSGVLADDLNLLLDGDFTVETGPEYEVVSEGKRSIVAPAGSLRRELLRADIDGIIAARAAFLNDVRLPEYATPAARRTALKAWSQLKTQICSPEGLLRHRWSTPDRWPHRNIWLWDSVFHAIGMRHRDPVLARELISAMFDLQQPDGLIPHSGNVDRVRLMTQPPVLSLAMRLIDAAAPAPEWIAELAPKLGRYLEWLMAHRDRDGGGLLEWEISDNPACRCGESGMDNSPRFDRANRLDATDFNAFLAFECESMAEFLPAQREYWLGHHRRLCRLMNERLWNDRLGMYVDFDLDASAQSDVLASSGFLPLYCGAASAEQANKLAAHLTDPATFGTPLRVPSIARNNSAAYRKDMWRGPVWVNINYLIALGLERYGHHELARSIVRDTMTELEKWYLRCGTFFEFYDDRQEVEPRRLERKGKMPEVYHPSHQVFHDYGWTATLYLEMLYRPEWN